MLLPGVGLRGKVRAGPEGDPLYGSVLVSALQNAHAGHAVGILVLDIRTFRNLDQSHGKFPFTVNYYIR